MRNAGVRKNISPTQTPVHKEQDNIRPKNNDLSVTNSLNGFSSFDVVNTIVIPAMASISNIIFQ